jgi:DNA polymerase III, delta subunit
MGFDSFLGNKKAVTAVRGMLASGQVPGSLLFSGPEGVGKKTLAVMLAKALVCERPGPEGNDFCDECPNCRAAGEMLAAGAEDLARRQGIADAQRSTENLVYFDIQIVAPITRFILTEQLRQLCAAAYARPFALPRRVLIIEDAQDIHWQAADLLLKVLEEPPETTTLILVCPNPYQLRTTIRSRCVRVDFAPVEDAILEPILALPQRIRAEQRSLALRLADGSMAKAKSPDFTEYEAQRRPWLDFIGALADSLASSRPDHWGKLVAASKAITADRQLWEPNLRVGYLLCRDMMVSLSESKGRYVVNADLKSEIGAWGRQLGFERLARLMTGLDEAYRLRARNVNAQIGLDALAAGILAGVGSETGQRLRGKPGA